MNRKLSKTPERARQLLNTVSMECGVTALRFTEHIFSILRNGLLGIGHQCRSCDNLVDNPGNLLWCDHCFSFFDDKKRCTGCGLQTGGDQQITDRGLLCGECLKKPPIWNDLYCVSDYCAPLKSDIYNLKYKHDAQIASDLGQLMARRLNEVPIKEFPTALIVVPVPWYRQWRRGYNQSYLLAKSIRKQWKLAEQQVAILNPIGRRSIGIGHTRMNRGERLLKSASEYYLKPRHAQRLSQHAHVAIVDDVVTTGATVKQISKLLLENGVQRIDIYCVCRTEKPN